LLKQELRDEYRQIMNDIDWLDFPDGHHIRPEKIGRSCKITGSSKPIQDPVQL
jgi:hypothetical protein